MLSGLLRLASSNWQSMELYNGRQVNNHHHVQPEQQVTSARMSKSFLQVDKLDSDHQVPNKQSLQCKPLDLSVKSSQKSASSSSSLVSRRRGRATAIKTQTCHQLLINHLQLPLNREQQDLPAPELIHQSTTKLITSSTSPSFCSTQSTGSSSSGSLLLDQESQNQQQLLTIPAKKTQTNVANHQKRGRTKADSGRRLITSDEVISSTNSHPSGTTTATLTSIGSKIGKRQKGTKSHLCLECGRSFSRSDMLIRHSRLHSGLKPYQCVRCKQVFSRSDHLSTHERTHTGEKPYQCSRCSYSACRRDMITRHMRTHSNSVSQLHLRKRPGRSRNRKSTLISVRSCSPSGKDNEISTSSLDLDIDEEDETKECDILD